MYRIFWRKTILVSVWISKTWLKTWYEGQMGAFLVSVLSVYLKIETSKYSVQVYRCLYYMFRLFPDYFAILLAFRLRDACYLNLILAFWSVLAVNCFVKSFFIGLIPLCSVLCTSSESYILQSNLVYTFQLKCLFSFSLVNKTTNIRFKNYCKLYVRARNPYASYVQL